MTKKKYIPNVINKVIESGNHYETQEYKKDIHRGEDLINRTNSTSAKPDWITAIDSGIVYAVGYGSKMGYYVKLKHDNCYSVYMHLKKGSIQVNRGKKVNKGDRLGFMGESGNADGIHLHLAIMPTLSTYTDPYPYLIGEKYVNNKTNEFNEGYYITLKNKYVRTSPEVKVNNKVRYSSIKSSLKANFIKDTLGYAKYKIGVTIYVTETTKDNKGNIWGKTLNTWLCLRDSSGNQVKKA